MTGYEMGMHPCLLVQWIGYIRRFVRLIREMVFSSIVFDWNQTQKEYAGEME
jgi:hypothetical protein